MTKRRRTATDRISVELYNLVWDAGWSVGWDEGVLSGMSRALAVLQREMQIEQATQDRDAREPQAPRAVDDAHTSSGSLVHAWVESDVSITGLLCRTDTIARSTPEPDVTEVSDDD